MMKGVFDHFTDGYLVVFGFMLFMAVFVGSLVWTLFIQKKSVYQNLSELPLVDGE